MTPALLAQIGELLYGAWWRDPLARAILVAERTIRRWANGDNPIPNGIDGELAKLCREKAGALIKAAEQLERSGGPNE